MRAAIVGTTSAAALVLSCSTIIGIEDRPLGDPHAAVSEAGPLAATTDAGADNVPFGAIRLEPAGCEVSPRRDPKVLDERCGVFVAPNGNDTNPGTRLQPLATLTAAIRAAAERKLHRAFACTGTFQEHLEISTVAVSLVGGLTCDGANWAVADQPTIVRPADADPKPNVPVLRVIAVQHAVVLEGFRFETRSAGAPGETSNPVFLSGSASVSFVRSTIAAGAGAPGEAGKSGELATGGGTNGNIGGSGGSALAPAAEVTCTCKLGDVVLGTSVGGGGGANGKVPTGGQPDGDGGAPGANSGVNGQCSAGVVGLAGAQGTTTTASPSPGTLSEMGWLPARGGDGTAGSIGQGGGGGGSSGLYAGGGGGCGGCPSTGGMGGTGGGGSIAIAAVSSGVALFESTIITVDGGAGGKGGAAPSGQPGGTGQGNVYGHGCSGGNGGQGGKGGDGVGGAGGVSVGILLARAPAPVIDASSEAGFRIGVAGTAGGGALPGPSGVSAKIFQSM